MYALTTVRIYSNYSVANYKQEIHTIPKFRLLAAIEAAVLPSQILLLVMCSITKLLQKVRLINLILLFKVHRSEYNGMLCAVVHYVATSVNFVVKKLCI